MTNEKPPVFHKSTLIFSYKRTEHSILRIMLFCDDKFGRENNESRNNTTAENICSATFIYFITFWGKNKHFCNVESPKKVLLKRNLKRNFSLRNLDLNLEFYT